MPVASEETQHRRRPGCVRLIITSIILLVLAIIWALFMAGDFRAFEVIGHSMLPTLSRGDRIIAERVDPTTLKRGDIVVVDLPSEDGSELIKRLVALPGDTIYIRGGVFYVNGHPENDAPKDIVPFDNTVLTPKIHLGPHSYYVLGDNRPISYDSEDFGPVSGNEIWGVVLLRYAPWDKRRKF